MNSLNNRNLKKNTAAVRGVARQAKRTVNAVGSSKAANKRKGSVLSYILTFILMLCMVVIVYFGDELKAKFFSEDNVIADTIIKDETAESDELSVCFRNENLLNDHYEKHGKEMGFASAKSYEAAACKVVENRQSLHKTEAEDGDDVYYLESTNELVIVSKDGYIRTYFCPSDGIDYYNRQ